MQKDIHNVPPTGEQRIIRVDQTLTFGWQEDELSKEIQMFE